MTKDDRKYGSNTVRNADGKFGPGNPGKPTGTRHRATRAVAELLDGESGALTRKALEMALAGDTTALRLCLERIAPPRRDSPVPSRFRPCNRRGMRPKRRRRCWRRWPRAT